MRPLVYVACPFDGCAGTIPLEPAWREWRGQCDACRRFVLVPDTRLEGPDLRSPCVLPAGCEWVRLRLAEDRPISPPGRLFS